MELDLLTAISPIDGRYRGKAGALASYFSEFALIKYRVQVEIEYFITLCELPLPQLKSFDHARFDALRAIYKNFSEADAQRIKEIESVTNHDVKAVEYFIKEEFDKLGGMEEYKEFIHFGLTSQDINNTSVPLSIKEALEQVYYPQIEELKSIMLEEGALGAVMSGSGSAVVSVFEDKGDAKHCVRELTSRGYENTFLCKPVAHGCIEK